MSKMSELDLCVGELRNAAQSLSAVADSLTALFSSNEAPEQKVSPAAAQAKPKAEPKPITLEAVRAVLADKARAGYTAQVRELLQKYGAERLSDIDPAKYPELLKDAEGLKNG